MAEETVFDKAQRLAKQAKAEHQSLELDSRTFTCWSPKRLTAQDITNILAGYGLFNDSLAGEQYGQNTVEWEIKVQIRRVGGDEIWP